MEILCEKKEAGTLLKVSGRMDAVSAPQFETDCSAVIDGGETVVVVDLSQLEYISSAGLRSLLASARKIKGVSGSLRFCGLKGMVEEVFNVSGLAAMFTIKETEAEAFAA